MSKNWKTYTFGEVVQFPPNVKLKKGESYPFIPMESITSGYKYVKPLSEKEITGGGAKFEEGDTLFARITPCLENNKIAQAKDLNGKPGFGSTEYFIFRGKDGVSDSDFVYYFSKTKWFTQNAINSMVGASGRQRADASFVKNLEVIFPPLLTQQKIADILSSYDDLIDNNLNRIKLLEEQAQLIYEEWFVRMRFPDHEDKQIDEESGLPEGWEIVAVNDLLAKTKSTKKIKKSEILDEGSIPVIDQSKDFISGFTDSIDACVETDDPIIVFGDHTRVLKLVNFNFARGADGTQLIVSNSERMPQHLFYHVLKAIDLSNYHYARHFKYLKSEEIILPDVNTANIFEDFVKQVYQIILKLRLQNEILREARDILLPRLMMGIIEV